MLNLWNWLNGRKTWLGLAVGFLYGGGLFLGLYDANPTIEGWIAVWTGGSMVHKVFKSQ